MGTRRNEEAATGTPVVAACDSCALIDLPGEHPLHMVQFFVAKPEKPADRTPAVA
jgi:hypothetical protein